MDIRHHRLDRDYNRGGVNLQKFWIVAIAASSVVAFWPSLARATCPPPIAPASGVSSLVESCPSWSCDVRYDPAQGYLPFEDPVAPWHAEIDPATFLELIEGKLVITDPPSRPEVPGDKNVAFSRAEPALGDPESWLYLLQVSFRVDKVHIYPDNPDEAFATFGAIDSERVALFSLGMYQEQRVAVAGGEIDWTGEWIPDAGQVMPWDFRTETTYTLVVHKGTALYLLVDGQPVMTWPYASLPLASSDPGADGVFGFTSTGSLAEYGPLQYCVCAAPPILGPQGKLSVSSPVVAPNPFDPEVAPAQMALRANVIELPGTSSGQFTFATKVSWQILSPYTDAVERSVVADQTVTTTGLVDHRLAWDGTNGASVDLPDGVYQQRAVVELIRTKTAGGQTKVVDTVETPWRDLTLERLVPIEPDPGVGAKELGITVRRAQTKPRTSTCYLGVLEYDVQGGGADRQFTVEYQWNHPGVTITGLAARTVRTNAEGLAQVKESFRVCSADQSSPVHVLNLQVVASSTLRRFTAFPSFIYLEGTDRLATDLIPQIKQLEAQLQGAEADPAILRRYWKLMAAYGEGGESQLQARIVREAQQSLSEFSVAPDPDSWSAHLDLLVENGERVNVSHSLETGEVVALTLNESYLLAEPYADSLIGMLTTGVVSRLLSITDQDELVITRTRVVGAGEIFTIERYRDGFQVVGDSLQVLVMPLGSRHYLHSVVSSFGRIGESTCADLPPSSESTSDASGLEFVSVHASARALLRRNPDNDYHCVDLNHGFFDDGSGDGEFPYARITDVSTGEVLVDGKISMDDGTADDPHHVVTRLSVPYRTAQPFRTPVRLPFTTIHGAIRYPLTFPLELTINSCELGFSGDFTPNCFGLLDPGYPHEGQLRYMQDFNTEEAPNIYQFDPVQHPNAEYSYYYTALTEELGNWNEYMEDINPPLDFTLTNDLWCSNEETDKSCRAIAAAGQADLFSQYARHIWMGRDENTQLPIWSDGPYPHDEGQRKIYYFEHEGSYSGTGNLCGRWAGGKAIHLYLGGHCQTFNGIVDNIPHELGHWTGNVWDGLPFTYDSCAHNLCEGFADYISDSLMANWRIRKARSHSDITTANWQFHSKDDSRRYRGNTLYPNLNVDHDWQGEGTGHRNMLNWSSTFLQLMNLVGNRWSDDWITSAYYASATWRPTGDDGEYGHDLCGFWGTRFKKAHYLYEHMTLMDAAQGDAPLPTDITTQLNTKDRRMVEIQRAIRQHNWHAKLKNSDPGKRNHSVSSAVSHATSLTLVGNEPAMAVVKYDSLFDTKWFNFYASANVTYRLASYSAAPTRMQLYSVFPSPSHTTGVQWEAYSYRCLEQTKIRTQDPSSEYSPTIIPVNDPGLCPPLGSELTNPMITFTPKRSGWYYAQVRSISGKSIGVVALSPVGVQITPVIPKNSSQAFVDAERRMGQSIPISYPAVLDGQRMEPRSGRFTKKDESHVWRFQTSSIRSIALPPNTMTEQLYGMVGSAAGLHFRYDIVLRRYGDSSPVSLKAYILDTTDLSGSTLVELPAGPNGLVYTPTNQGNIVEDTWTVDASVLHEANGLSNGDNVYLAFQWSPRREGYSSDYHVYVVSRSDAPYSRWSIDSHSVFPDGAISVRRYCNNEMIERSFDSYTINERIGPTDSDYFLIWMQEGEKLNVTYRGEAPAVLDAAGPQKDLSRLVDQSELAETISRDVYKPDTWDGIAFVQDWRPFLVDDTAVLPPSDYVLPAAQSGAYFAERGYLWRHSLCSRQQCEQSTMGGYRPKCGLCDGNNDIPLLSNNEPVLLSLTAFVTGEYSIRVRGQGDENSPVVLDGWYNWDHFHQMIGAPYTLTFNIGVERNKPRPHWQFMESANPVRVPICGR